MPRPVPPSKRCPPSQLHGVVYSGHLLKRGSGEGVWRRRFFVIHDNCLYCYRDKREEQPSSVLPLMGCPVEVLDDPEEVVSALDRGEEEEPPLETFSIVFPDKTLLLRVDPHMDDGSAGDLHAVVRGRRKSVVGAEASFMALGSSKGNRIGRELLRTSRADVCLQTGQGLAGWVSALVESQLQASDSRSSSVVMCGWLNVRDDMSPWERLFCVLDKCHVMFFRSGNDFNPIMAVTVTDTPVGRFSDSMSASSDGEFAPEVTLYISTPDTTLFLAAESTTECSRWMRCIFRNQVADSQNRS